MRFHSRFSISTGKWPAVALDKNVHRTITNRFREACFYGKKYSVMTKKRLKSIVNEVYYDMPELRTIALEQIDNYYTRPKLKKATKGRKR